SMRDCRSWLLLLLLLAPVARGEQPLAASTVVVYNKAAGDSAELARFYAKQRGIANDHVVGVSCSNSEEISRDEYDAYIADPLREVFKERGWWTWHETPDHQTVVTATTIRFVALMKGMPLKIKTYEGTYAGDKPVEGPVAQNASSVDSELAVLGSFSRQISGLFHNPYFQSYKAIGEFENPVLMLVCRLDAPDAVTVKRMITDSIATEKRGLWGRAFVDGAHDTRSGYELGDQWLADIPKQLHKVGVPVVYENTPDILPEGYPITDCSLYYGWRAEKVSGAFASPDFRFARGAIAVHLHSFSAYTLREPNNFWVTPLLSRGAAASLGNVYEPYLQFTAHLNVFNDRLLHGFTFAESAYSSIPVLSWMSVMVGDPLYRPFGAWLQIDATGDSSKADSWKMYHEFTAQNFSNETAQYRSLARQAAVRAHNCPMLEDLGLMELADGNFAAATNYLGQAHSCYSARDDILRVILEEADAWNKLKKPKRAVDLLRTALRVSGNAPAAPLLKKMEAELRGEGGGTPAPGATPKPTPRIRVRF
ncbi:MAG TPA: TIGR03790 family protein, partial [Chthoniobacterales bacterium]